MKFSAAGHKIYSLLLNVNSDRTFQGTLLCLSPLESGMVGVEVKLRIGLAVGKICPASKFSPARFSDIFNNTTICNFNTWYTVSVIVFVAYPSDKVCDLPDLWPPG